MINYLHQNLPGSSVRAYHGEAGWIIEIIHPQLNNNRQGLLNQIENALNNLPAHIQRDIIWKLFLYSAENERFKDSGTLHTNPQEYDDAGSSIITLGASDTYVDLTEYDCEIISFNNYHGLQMAARVAVGTNGQPILPYHVNTQYLWLEAMGGHYEIQNVRQNADPHSLTIILRG